MVRLPHTQYWCDTICDVNRGEKATAFHNSKHNVSVKKFKKLFYFMILVVVVMGKLYCEKQWTNLLLLCYQCKQNQIAILTMFSDL